MTLNELTVESTVQARALAREYRDAVKRRRNAEDEAIAKSYTALAKGKRVIALTPTIEAAGLDASGLPRLAAVRADLTRCKVEVRRDSVAFGPDNWWSGSERFKIKTLRTSLARETFNSGPRAASAIVPLIPPRFRPAGDLKAYTLLFEAEWGPVAPVDPVLLKRLHGDLYVVLAAWDLTPVERAAIAGR